MSLLEIKHVKKSFGDVEVLKDISLTVDHPAPVNQRSFGVQPVWRNRMREKSYMTAHLDLSFRTLIFFHIFQ